MFFIKKISLIIISLLAFLSFSSKVKAIEGIDVSEFQGNINFREVKDYGIEIVYIRSSASHSYIDAKFEENYQKAKENNLKIGFYHYVTARNIEEAQEQARFFATVIKGKEADCRLAMDFETFRGLTKEEINSIAKSFLEELKRLTEKEVVIYSDAYNAKYTFDEALFEEYPLWLAEYGVKEPEAKNFIGWQYTDKGIIPGIKGYVDRDIFKNEIYLENSSAIKEPELKPEEKKKTIYYRVKFGDTLYHIAKEYNITINDLIVENNIKNPNLIFPNEVLKINTDIEKQVIKSGNNDNYIVKIGDTLTRIANIFHVTISNLVSWNDIKNPNLIYPNERLEIKPTNNNHLIKYVVKKGDTLTLIANDYHTSVFELVLINKIKDKNQIKVGEVLYIPETYLY